MKLNVIVLALLSLFNGSVFAQSPTPVPSPTPIPVCAPAPVPPPPFAAPGYVSNYFLPLDKNGFTILPDVACNAHSYYVSSSSGDDKNPGTELLPFKTIHNAVQIMRLRKGYADRMLLKRGDTFLDGAYLPGGQSGKDPMVMTSYGDPKLDKPLVQGDPGLSLGGGNFVVSGIHFKPVRGTSLADGESNWVGILSLAGGGNILIEDCLIEGYGNNLTLQAGDNQPFNNLIIRRNVIVDAWHNWDAHAQGIFLSNAHQVLFEENVFDHNGWNEAAVQGVKTIFNHNMYLSAGNSGLSIRGNVIARASSHGTQARTGAVISNNLYLGNAIAGFTGINGGQWIGNVIEEPSDITKSGPRGWGVSIDNVDPHYQSKMDNNIAIMNHSAGNGFGMKICCSTAEVSGNAFYDWKHQFYVGNTEQPQPSPAPVYADPKRSVETYMAMLGKPATMEAYLSEVRKQSKDNWRPEFTTHAVMAYIKQGFVVVPPAK